MSFKEKGGTPETEDREKDGVEMEAYTGFAEVYDTFMDNVPYEEWSAYVVKVLQEQGITQGVVAELGCGTGKITELLALQGYDMIGLDCSEDMLAIASDKLLEYEETDRRKSILYILQDMREMEFYEPVDAMVSLCDSMNYITEEEDLKQVFSLVNQYLSPDGVFLFDMNTEYKYREILGDCNICENREDASFIWENYYYPEEKINEYDLTIYARTPSGLYERMEENHFQKAYSIDTVQRLLEEAGLKVLEIYDAYTKQPPAEQSERICVLAGKK